ncbi:MAG TPA: hypothetical protein VFZ64_07345 [Nocardioidaceae bacterium]
MLIAGRDGTWRHDAHERSPRPAASAAATLAGRYVAGRNAVDREARTPLAKNLSDLGTVEQLTILPVVERLTARPGLLADHLPVHAAGTPLVPQAVLGNPNWPWRPIREADARR